MNEGIVKFFNNDRGYGFIIPNDGSADIFVHQNGLTQKIRDNDRVKYELSEGQKGMSAINVRVIQ